MEPGNCFRFVSSIAPTVRRVGGSDTDARLEPAPEYGEEDVGQEGHWCGAETAASPAMAPVLLPSSWPRR